jgi:hypothetical protein
MSKAEYEALIQASEKERETSIVGFSKADTSDAAFYLTSAKKLRKAAAELDDVAPPTEVAAANEAYISSLTGLAAIFESFAECAESDKKLPNQSVSGDDCRRAIGQPRLDEVQNDYDEAAAIFRAKGYSLTA